jgi:hypothetical protein
MANRSEPALSEPGHTQGLRGREPDQAKVREFPSGPGAPKINAPFNEAEYMTATGSSLIALQKQSCARERSIYVCGGLLILPKSTIGGWDDGADRASNDADVSIVPPKIPYGGFSPVRLQGRLIGRGLPSCRLIIASRGLHPSFVPSSDA